MAKEPLTEEYEVRQVRRARRGIARKVLAGVWILLAAFLVYVGVQVVLVLTPNIRTEIAILDTMVDSVSARGFVALESQAVTSGGGSLYYTVASGERVSAGTPVAQIYAGQAGVQARMELDSVNHELDNLETAGKTSTLSGDTQNYLRDMQAGLQGLLNVVDNGDYSGLEEALGEVTLASNKLQIATGVVQGFEARQSQLLSRRTGLEGAALPTGEITAPTTGYFVHASGKDRVPKAYETLSGYTPADLQLALEAPAEYYGGDVVGYIIGDYKWYFFALVSEAEAARFQTGDKSLSVSFTELGTQQLPVTVQSVVTDEATGMAKVELYCEYISPEILKMQSPTVEIIFRTEQGIRISREALRIYEGQTGVYILFNNTIYFRRISILLEDEFYMLVPEARTSGENELRLYDTVIVDSGGMELNDQKAL